MPIGRYNFQNAPTLADYTLYMGGGTPAGMGGDPRQAYALAAAKQQGISNAINAVHGQHMNRLAQETRQKAIAAQERTALAAVEAGERQSAAELAERAAGRTQRGELEGRGLDIREKALAAEQSERVAGREFAGRQAELSREHEKALTGMTQAGRAELLRMTQDFQRSMNADALEQDWSKFLLTHDLSEKQVDQARQMLESHIDQVQHQREMDHKNFRIAQAAQQYGFIQGDRQYDLAVRQFLQANKMDMSEIMAIAQGMDENPDAAMRAINMAVSEGLMAPETSEMIAHMLADQEARAAQGGGGLGLGEILLLLIPGGYVTKKFGGKLLRGLGRLLGVGGGKGAKSAVKKIAGAGKKAPVKAPAATTAGAGPSRPLMWSQPPRVQPPTLMPAAPVPTALQGVTGQIPQARYGSTREALGSWYEQMYRPRTNPQFPGVKF